MFAADRNGELLRDAEYGSDIGDAEKAQRGLGHTQRSTTDIYLRDRKGGLAEALSHGIADNIPEIADKR